MDQLPKFLKTFSLISMLVALSACTTTSPIARNFVINDIPRIEVSERIKKCRGGPEYPTGDYSQRDVAIYIEQLRFAHLNCAGNLAVLAKSTDTYNEQLAILEAKLKEQASKE